jgi:hypothetical protein
MATKTKRSGSKRKPPTSARQANARGAGNQKELLQAMAKGLGNQAIEERLARAGGQRDRLLAFIAQRLEQIRDTQLRESGMLHQRGQWWRDAAWREPGVWAPQPERWGAVAREYRQAMEALCRGDLSRGARLLERATAAEREAIEAIPDGAGVDRDQEREELLMTRSGEVSEGIEDGEGCPEREPPKEHRLAHQIESFSHTVRPLRGIRVVPHATPWWEEEEEEEEEEEGGGS